MTDLSDVFWRAHRDLPREAPGSAASTELLLRLVGELPPAPDVVDIGCGTGPATLALAARTGGHVTAVDLHQPSLDVLVARARTAGLGERVSTLAASMTDLPLEDGCADLLWAEGAAYVMGFDAALEAWRRLLRPGGALVLTEAEWLTPEPNPAARVFWDQGYPGMRTTAANVEAAQGAGWIVAATYVLPDSDWNEYYAPLSIRCEQLRAEGVDPGLLAQVAEEVVVREQYGGDYGYTGYVLRPRS